MTIKRYANRGRRNLNPVLSSQSLIINNKTFKGGMLYGIHGVVCGVYILKCKINNKEYVGSSTDISGRLSTHFGRECKLYPYKPLYQDIIKYGRDNFEWEILEECTREELHDKEQYWYDIIKPKYNLNRPFDMKSITDKECLDRIRKGNEIGKQKLKDKFSNDSYKNLFKDIQRKSGRMVSVIMLDKITKEKIMTFECCMDAQRWLNKNTTFKSKNKVAKILECCKGIRTSAFGYKWEYVDDMIVKKSND